MTVIDLRVRRSRNRGLESAPGDGSSIEVQPERDLLRIVAQRGAGRQVAALDGVCSVLGALSAAVLIPSVTPSVAVATVVGWWAALASTRRYGNQLRHGRVRELGVIGAAAWRLCGALAVLTVAVPSLPLAGLVVTVASVAAFTAVGRRTVAERLIPATSAGRPLPVLVRGPGEDVRNFLSHLGAEAPGRYEAVAVQVTDGLLGSDWVAGDVLLPETEDPVVGAVRSGAQAVMLVGSQQEEASELRRRVWRLEGHGIATHMVPIVANLAPPSAGTIEGTGLPLLSFQARDLGSEVGISKVVIDKILALTGLIAVAPVLLATGVAVRLTSPGPVIFKQVRVGRGGRQFVMYKYRTMYRDAEERRAALEAQNEHDGGVLFKMKHDPRVTPLGRWLRRLSIDELPQLINVLRGEMSLVGPRPPLPSEVAKYQLDAHRRFRVRPGLTGLWQISGRSDLDEERSVHLDMHYVEHWSPAMDARIIAKTPRAVFSGRGAY